MESKTLVVKSNELIEARYDLNLNEQKIILYAASKLDKNKEKFNILEMDIREFTDLINTSEKRYTELRQVVRELRKKEIIIKLDKNNSEKELITGWLSSIEYKGNGKIELEFSAKLAPYLLQLQERFTKYELKNVLYLKNKYSIRIYELLKQYEKIGKREFELEEFKKIIGCEGRHDRYNHFRERVLEPARKEITELTDILFDYESIADGRKVKGIKFTIVTKGKLKKEEDTIDWRELYSPEEIENIKIKSGLINEEFNLNQLIELYTIATDRSGEEPYEYIKINYNYMIEKGTVRNKFGWLKKALEEDYAKAYSQIAVGYIV